MSRPFLILIGVVCFGAQAVNMFVLTARHLRLLGASEPEIGLVMGMFPLSALVAMLLVPRLADRFGRRRVLAGGALICGLGCLGFVPAEGLLALCLARTAQGVGWASVLVAAGIMTTEIAPPGRLGQALGVSGVLTLLAMAIGPLAGEALVAWGVRAPFQPVFAPLFVVAALLCALSALLALPLPETGVRQPGPAPARVRPPGLLLAATFASAMGFGAIVSFLADYTQLLGIRSMAPFFQAYVGVAIVVRLAFGSLSDRIGRKAIIAPALVAQAIAIGGLAWLRAGWLVPLGMIYGIAQGLYYPALQALVVERVEAPARASAVAWFSFSFSAGMAAAAFVNGGVAKRFGYPAVFLEVGLAALAAVALVLLERPRSPAPVPARAH